MRTPWVAKEYPADDAWHIHTPDGGWLASVHIDGEPELARNQARLIAAAPELLEALMLFDAYLALPQDRGGPTGPKGLAHQAWIDAKNAAIAKATQP